MSEKFEYLFKLPYELIVKILSGITINELDSFCSTAKNVEYGYEYKLDLKDLCNDIWYQKYSEKFGPSNFETNDWRKKYLSDYEQYFVTGVKKYMMDNAVSYNSQSWKGILDFLVENKDYFNLNNKKLLNFRTMILEKLYQLIQINDKFDFYLEQLFGEQKVNLQSMFQE